MLSGSTLTGKKEGMYTGKTYTVATSIAYSIPKTDGIEHLFNAVDNPGRE